jgi:mevalonate kinase
MSLKDTVNTFNKEIVAFMEMLQNEVCPGDKDVATYNYQIKLLIKASSATVITRFAKEMLQYTEQINAANEEFFRKVDINKQIEGDASDMTQIMKFTAHWDTLSKEKKDFIFERLKTLVFWAGEYKTIKKV